MTKDYTAWLLDEAVADLERRGLAARVVETAPPARPAPRDKSQRPRRKGLEEGAHPAHKPREPHWGAWRVLRSSLIEGNAVELVELLVAREQLAPPETPP
jgi:hypothetical protein